MRLLRKWDKDRMERDTLANEEEILFLFQVVRWLNVCSGFDIGREPHSLGIREEYLHSY